MRGAGVMSSFGDQRRVMGALQREGGRCNPRIIFVFKARKHFQVPGERHNLTGQITECNQNQPSCGCCFTKPYQCNRVGDVLIPPTEKMLFIA